MSKRILSLVLALVMVLGTFSFAFAAEPVDGPTDNGKVNWLIQEGLVEGDEQGYRLEDPIKRSEVAAMVVRARGQEDLADSLASVEKFPDVLTSPADKWANGYINVAAADGIVTGYEDGTFRPANNITKAEAVAMMVRVAGGLSEEEEKLAVGKNWAAPYLIKAHELGILEGVELGNANEAATREFVFEIVYNTIHTADSGRYSIVKAIVLENYRVENLDKDEVVVEVISEIQKSKFADESRRIEGAQYSLIIPENVGDVEDLLGKVANITVEGEIRDGAEAVRVVVDDTYKYAVGAITSVGKNRIVVNYSDRYTVELPERYDKSDERIFRTYYNNESFAYEDFVEEEVYPEFARITVKNGKVLFIDAFDFDDIAPVQEVRNDGRVVYVYNDEADGALKKLEFNSRTNVIIIDGTKMSVGSLEDIEAMDVVHYIADENTVFVRVDAEVEGVYEKASSTTIEGVSIVNIFVDGEAYAALTKTPYRKAVYTYNLEDFATLEGSPSYIDERLSAYKDEEVVLLLDMNDNVQYIAAEVKDTHFVAMIKDILGTEVELELVDGEEEVYEASLKRSTLIAYEGRNHSLKEGRLEAFNKGDLVRVLLDDEGYIAKLVKLADNKIDNEAWENEKYAGYSDRIATGEAVLTGNLRYNKARGAFAGEENEFYYVNKNTAVFIYTGGEPTATTMSEVLKNYKLFDADGNPLDDVEGYIIYDEVVPEKENLAKVVVFTAIKPVGPAYDTIVRKFVRHEYTGGKNYIVVEDTAGERKTHEVANRSAVLGLAAGDIVELEVTKNDAQVVRSATILIDASKANVYRVDRRSGRRITLEDANGDKLAFWLSTVANEFGEIEADARVQIDLEGKALVEDGLITNIVSTTQGLRGTFEEEDDDQDDGDGPTGTVTYIDATSGVMVVDKVSYVFNDATILFNEKGTIIAVGKIKIEEALTENVDTVKDIKVENGIVKTLVGVYVKKEIEAAKEVVDLINNFTTPDAKEEEVLAARSAYEELTPSQKDLVTNYATLVAEEAKLAAAKAKEEAENFKATHADALSDDNATLANVNAALTAYENLDADVKALLTEEKAKLDANLAKLEKEAVEDFENALLEGDNAIVGSVTIEDGRKIGNLSIDTDSKTVTLEILSGAKTTMLRDIKGTGLFEKALAAGLKKINGKDINRDNILEILDAEEDSALEEIMGTISVELELANNVKVAYTIVIK